MVGAEAFEACLSQNINCFVDNANAMHTYHENAVFKRAINFS